ncbi:MAG: DUF4347 domain-containing protein, partial [Cyanothece sp. SIO1E1]|nr:DUF4347 domain-containing protein [Cyanothece sp. SIO1E1]
MKTVENLSCKRAAEATAPKFSLDLLEGRDVLETTNLVIIDSGVDDYSILLDGLLPQYQPFIIAGDKDGLEQITLILSEFKDVSSIHIVSHGSPAFLKLGSTELCIDNIVCYVETLEKWSHFLAGNAQIFLYGCCVADGLAGRQFIHKLHEVTGVAIAASSTPTGHLQEGANWQLDARTGQIDITFPFDVRALDAFPGTLAGEALFTVTPGSNSIQISNFGEDSFSITNTGDKKITQVEIDVTNALYPDSVFDPFGLAGDTASKPLQIDSDGGTGVVLPSSYDPYSGAGGTSGYEVLTLFFDEANSDGFEPGETVGFSIDMDPNSVAGSNKSPLDAGSNPSWDVGGISGAELIGSTVTITFADGTTATGQLQGDGSRGGSQALVSQNLLDLSVSLTVNGLDSGGVGTYGDGGPTVIINGPAGETARVVLTKGFIQPVSLDGFVNGSSESQAHAPVLQAQLDALAASDFPANNAVEFQTVDVLLTGEDQDISEQFNFADVSQFDFEGEDQLPFGFVASVIDPQNSNLPVGPVTSPIYLVHETPDPPADTTAPVATVNAANVTVSEDGLTSYSFSVSYSDSSGIDAG